MRNSLELPTSLFLHGVKLPAAVHSAGPGQKFQQVPGGVLQIEAAADTCVGGDNFPPLLRSRKAALFREGENATATSAKAVFWRREGKKGSGPTRAMI